MLYLALKKQWHLRRGYRIHASYTGVLKCKNTLIALIKKANELFPSSKVKMLHKLGYI